MKTCTYCGRKFREDGFIRCQECRERSKVREHQLHKRRASRSCAFGRRFKKHDCRLCRKHRGLVKALIERWDRRRIWMKVKCFRGHWYLNWGSNSYCGTCYRKYTVPELIKSGIIPKPKRRA